MANKQGFDGRRLSIKVGVQTFAHLDREAALQHASRDQVGRSWLENWRTLASLSPFLHARLVWAAARRRVSVAALVNEALTQYCTTLESPPTNLAIPLPIDVLDVEPRGPQKSGRRKSD